MYFKGFYTLLFNFNYALNQHLMLQHILNQSIKYMPSSYQEALSGLHSQGSS